MTRRLVDVPQDIIVREVDCFETKGERVRGLTVQDIVADGETSRRSRTHHRGRVAAET
jgi:DNA-directed RNA polymerase subunit beta'